MTDISCPPPGIGDLERVSSCRRRPVSRRVVTGCDRLMRLTLGFRSIAGTCSWPSPPGLSLAPEVPDDHSRPIHCPRPDPAHLHRPRAARARRIPGRVSRVDPRGLHPGPAPVHHLVPHPLPELVRRPPRRHRRLRTRSGSQGPRPRHRHPPAVHHRRVLPGTPSKRNSWSTPRPPTSAGHGWTTNPTPRPWTATSSAPYWSLPGSARRPSMR